jgi:hypothetical protein
MYHAVVRVIETSADDIEHAFKGRIFDAKKVGNLLIQVSETNRYSFDVINPDIQSHHSVDWIIARQYNMYETTAALKNGMLEIVDFMTRIFTEEGMFLVEHTLLLPSLTTKNVPLNQFLPVCTENCNSCQPIDPYSYRISVVLPGWTYRFANVDFRNFMEELIRKEIPAHILARICWIGYRKNEVLDNKNEMLLFEKAWKEYLKDKTKTGQVKNKNKLIELINILSELNSIYPKGRLIDCTNEEDSLEGKIILGRTYIGNL